MKIFIINLVFFVLFDSNLLYAAQFLNVLYIEYPPYYYTEKENPSGFILNKTIRALDCSGVEYILTSVPSKRALLEIKQRQNVMSIGWFKNPEREIFANYSIPLCQSKPQHAVYKKYKSDQFAEYNTLNDLITKSKLKIGVISGHSEGIIVDEIINRNKKKCFQN